MFVLLKITVRGPLGVAISFTHCQPKSSGRDSNVVSTALGVVKTGPWPAGGRYTLIDSRNSMLLLDCFILSSMNSMASITFSSLRYLRSR